MMHTSRQQNISQQSTIEPGFDLPNGGGSGYVTPDVYTDQILDRERMRNKQLELRCEELRLENFKLVEGPGGVLELKRMLTNKELHFEEVERSIREQKSELLQKLEQQTELLNKLQDEVYRMRKDQENYESRFQRLNQEKERIQDAMNEELSKFQKRISALQADKRELENKLRKSQLELDNTESMKMMNQTKSYQEMRDMRDNFEVKINELLYNLDNSKEDRAHKDRLYDEEHQIRLTIEDKLDRFKQLSQRQGKELERLNAQLEKKTILEIQLNEERTKRMRVEDSTDKFKQLSKRQSEQIDRLRALLDSNTGKDQLLDIEREKRDKAQDQADKYRQLSERQMNQIDRLSKLVQTERQKKNQEIDKLREQFNKTKMQARTRVEQVVKEKVRITEEQVRKQFEAQKVRLGNQIRNIKIQNENIVNRVSDSKDQVIRLRKEVLDWQKRGDIYQSTIMGLRVQINYLEQQRIPNPPPLPPQPSPIRTTRVVETKSVITSMVSSAKKTSYLRNVTPSPERRHGGGQGGITARGGGGASGRGESVSPFKNGGGGSHSHSHSAMIGSQFTDKQRQKMLESYSMNLLKSIEKKASASGKGGIDERFKHLATNPVFSSFASKFIQKSTYHSSGAHTPKPAGNRSNLSLYVRLKYLTQIQQKLSTPQKGSGNRVSNLFQSGGSGSVSKIQQPKSFQQDGPSSAFELGGGDKQSSGTVNTGRFGKDNSKSYRKNQIENNEQNEGDIFEEENDDQAGIENFEPGTKFQRKEIVSGDSMNQSADFPHHHQLKHEGQQLKEQYEEDQQQGSDDFEIVKNKLVHIGDTSRKLGKKADQAAQDIQSHRKAYESVGAEDQDVFDRPPSFGDAGGQSEGQ